MRKSAVLILVLVVSLTAVLAFAGDKPWFDMENCAMCKPMMANPELMQNMTWEHHDISNGIISITTVAEDYMPAFQKLQAEFEATGKKLQAGEDLPLCGMCTKLSAMMMNGAKPEYIPTLHGSIMMVTASDTEMVTNLHDWAKRTNEELKKMEAMKKTEMKQKKG